jgi:hypothetical protein
MKLVAEYLADSIKFDQMAEDATDAALKASFRKQAGGVPETSAQESQAVRHAVARRSRTGA